MAHDEWMCVVLIVKYLWLLFDLAVGGENMVEKGPYPYIFSTEGHLFPMTPEISLRTGDCTYAGSFCNNSNHPEGMVNYLKTDVKEVKELQANEREFGTGYCPAKESTQVIKDKNSAVHGIIKGVCPGLSHWRKFGISSLADDVSMERKASRHSQDDEDNQHKAGSNNSPIVMFFHKDDQESVISDNDTVTEKPLSDSGSFYGQDLTENENLDDQGNRISNVITTNHLHHNTVDDRSSQNFSEET